MSEVIVSEEVYSTAATAGLFYLDGINYSPVVTATIEDKEDL